MKVMERYDVMNMILGMIYAFSILFSGYMGLNIALREVTRHCTDKGYFSVKGKTYDCNLRFK